MGSTRARKLHFPLTLCAVLDLVAALQLIILLKAKLALPPS